MKPLLFIALLIAGSAIGQTLEQNSDGIYLIQEIKYFPEMTAEEIHNKTYEWIARSYTDANDEIQMNDVERRKIIVKGSWMTNAYMKTGWIFHTLIIESKDGKTRITYRDFVYSNADFTQPFEEPLMSKKKMLSRTYDEIAEQMESFEDFMSTNTASEW
jgi:hypothetical protein